MSINTKGKYTYGNKSTSGIASITGMNQGNSVFNTDNGYKYYYDGSVWINTQMIGLINDSGATLNQGESVNPSSSTDNKIVNGTTTSQELLMGLVVVTTSNGGVCPFAFTGVYSAKTSAAGITRGDFPRQSTSTNSVMTSLISGNPGVGGIGLVTGSGGTLVNMLIKVAEKF